MPRRPRPAPPTIALALSVLLAAGCGAEAPKVPLFPASGRVLFGDRPADGVEVRLFDAENVADPDRPHPFATTDAEGRFDLGTFEAGDGAPARRYKVMLLWPEGPPGPGVPRDRFGRAFTDPSRSPFEATIAEGAPTLPPFVVDPDVVEKAARAASRRKDQPDPTDPSATPRK